ncbi:MAG: class I SAM-dependent DNA methyltransferase [Planctomycetes bacterium]|nr:class I SAM-dependent DNA methyltransferase [Planctomycetota bacterium]
MTVSEFVAKWQKVALTERAAAQQHFLDLCDLFEHPKPADADPTGEWFTFEKGAAKHGGGDGFADVWKRGFFGWEYKGKHKDLDAAYDQLLQYREALENPPLLVVCDMDRIVVHTNFTATVAKVHDIPLAELHQPRNLEILRAVFHSPDQLKPGVTSAAITAEAASRLADIAQGLRARGLDAHQVAHFLDRIVFCLFAEDVGLLPKDLFRRLVENTRESPSRFTRLIGQLFEAMAQGGDFGLDKILCFNGSLFTAEPVLELTPEEIERIHAASQLEWSAVDPSIFGTLFERGMDPAKRAQLGAHYTSREDIETLVEPVVMQPLRREWQELRQTVANLLTTGRKKPTGREKSPPSPAVMRKARTEADLMIKQFLLRLARVKVLDPACGSGNFLYVTLQKLKDLEKEVVVHATQQGFREYLPLIGPWQLYGIEVNSYAFDLAQMTVWIGYLQWTRANGYGWPVEPILRPMEKNFQCMDAILACSSPIHGASETPDKSGYYEPEWPQVDFVVGNPPFLGGKKMRAELGDEYVDKLFSVWKDRVPPEADLCCYWFEKARKHVQEGKCQRAGLLATQGIRGGANREVLKRIKESGDIFFAESDRPWILDGANVHVSMVAFDGREEPTRTLDGKAIATINANLSSAADVAEARRLEDNVRLGFMGTTKQGPFDIPEELALQWLSLPNPHGRPNSDVLVPWINGQDVTKRGRSMWIIDFFNMTEAEAAGYESPFAYVTEHVRKAREAKPRDWYRPEWWQLYAQRPEMRNALARCSRFIVTPRVAKHRLFVWLAAPTNPDCQLIVFARSDDYFFGVLQSRVHEVWALKLGTRLETRPRYTPTTCFETFPFPELTDGLGTQMNADGRGYGETSTGSIRANPRESASHSVALTIAQAAKELDELRNRWLNPPEWVREEVIEFPGSVHGPWARYVVTEGDGCQVVGDRPGADAETRGHGDAGTQSKIPNPKSKIGTVRYPRLVPKDAECAKKLAKRTLTNLYNERPTWLQLAHRRLDAAVFAAYGWPTTLTDEEILEKLLELNLARSDEGNGLGRR